MIRKQGSLQPQLHNNKINIIKVQISQPLPVLVLPQPQSLPPKKLLNIFPPKVFKNCMYLQKFFIGTLKLLLYTTYYAKNKKMLQIYIAIFG